MGPNNREYPSRSQQVALLVLAAALVAAGVAGGQWFMDADYVVYGYSDKTEWTVTAGYTVAEFWGLVLQTVCLPLAAIALLTWISFFYKSSAWPSWLKALMFLSLLLALLICAGIASDTMTDGLVECLWSLCQDFSTSSSSDAFTAFIPTVGIMYFCVLVMFALLAAGLLIRTSTDMLGITSTRGARGLTWGADNKEEEYQPLIPSSLPPARGSTEVITGTATTGGGSDRLASSFPSAFVVSSMERQRRIVRRRVSAIWLAGVFCCFIPFFIFASMAIGDSWEHLTVSGVQSYASSSATQAYGTIWNISLSSSVILKLYPDVLIYWGFVYLVVIIALLARAWSPVRSFLAAPLGIGRISWSNGQAFLLATLIALLVCEGSYWYFDHGWGSTVTTDKTWQERLARTMGQLANVTMGLMILPVTRNGVIEKVFGMGWESMVAYHRRMARVFLALVLTHMVFFWWVFWQNGYFWHDWPIAIPTEYHYDNWTIPLATLTTWAMVILMYCFSLERVRRACYELFYFSHHFFMVVWAMMLWHAASAWYYIAGSIALWILDRFIRVSKGLTVASVKGFKSFGGVTRLSYMIESGGIGPWGGSHKAMLHEAGQFVFLNVPAISLLEWHPFTISSCPDDQETTHHIKDMGPNTFTNKLRMLAASGEGLTVNVDGPYGVPLEYERYRVLVLVAGGIGVTPCVSLLRHLNHLSRAGRLTHCLDAGVRLIWSTRSMEELVMLEKELQDVAEEGEDIAEAYHAESPKMMRFSVHLHLTSGVSPDDFSGEGVISSRRRTCLPYTEGRPHLPTYLARFSQPLSSSRVVSETAGGARGVGNERPSGRVEGLVFACGPSGLMEASHQAAGDAGMDFRREMFQI